MQRNLILGERIMYVDAQTPVNCVFAVRIRGPLLPENLRWALSRLQAKHPLLQAGILEDKKGRPYFFLDDLVPRIPIRIVERLSDDDWLAVSETEWKTPFDARKGPLARLIWLRSGEVSELILVCPHCICDGSTCVTLMQEMLALLHRPDQDMRPYTLFRSVRELIPGSILSDKGKILKAAILSVIARIFFAFKSIGKVVPPIGKQVAGGKDYVIHWKLNGKASALLAERCKAEGVSIYSALCVAFLSAFRQVRKTGARNKLICPVDIRRFVPEIKKDMMFAFAPITELSLEEGTQMGFWDKARKLKEEMTRKIAAVKAYELLLFSEYYHSSARKLVELLRSDEGGHDFTFSNMGRLDIPDKYDLFSLETIFSPTVAF